jgi:hypothetical protein
MRKPANEKHLTPYQQVEHEIREASNDERSGYTLRRAGDPATRPSGHSSRAQRTSEGPGPTDDDLSPETLIHEDGARSPYEEGDDIPADRTYRVVHRDEAGGTFGLDEAELAHIDPLDGEPWAPEDEEPEDKD